MNFENCPLCLSRDLNIIEKIRVSDIDFYYKKIHDLEIKYLFGKNEIFLIQCRECKIKFFTDTIPGDEIFYKTLQNRVPDYYAKERQEFSLVLKYFNVAASVLEVGGGEGWFSKFLDVDSYTGLDLSLNAVLKAEKEGIEMVHSTIQEYSQLNKEKFDIICGFQVLEHIDPGELRSFFEAVQKLLKDNGLLILSLPADSSFVGNHPNLVLNLPPHHLTRWPDESFYKIEELYRFKLIELINEDLKEKNYNAWIINSILCKLNIHRKIVAKKLPIHHKIIYRLVRALNFRIKKKIIDKYKPRGHSIIAVYQKQIDENSMV